MSALQKSVRGSDPHAAVHYLARLLEGGADIVMIGRRLMVMASEDIGMAYPSAISIVTSCVQAAQMIGLPEAKINLAQAVVLLASCPKSNASIRSTGTERSADLRSRKIDDVPGTPDGFSLRRCGETRQRSRLQVSSRLRGICDSAVLYPTIFTGRSVRVL